MGRKRHIVVDSQGSLLYVYVHPANIDDRVAAYTILEILHERGLCPPLVWADRGYAGHIRYRIFEHFDCVLATTKPQRRPDQTIRYPKRWVVERTFAWLMRCRRLSKDFEFLPVVSEAFIYLAMARLLLAPLANL
jgi:putative transposase